MLFFNERFGWGLELASKNKGAPNDGFLCTWAVFPTASQLGRAGQSNEHWFAIDREMLGPRRSDIDRTIDEYPCVYGTVQSLSGY